MAVAFDAFSENGVGGATASSWSFTHTPSGAPSCVVVDVFVSNAGSTVSGTPTYGGEAMTLLAGPLDNASAAGDRLYVYGLTNPPSGAQTVAGNFAGAVGHYIACRTYTGSSTSAAFDTPNIVTRDHNDAAADPYQVTVNGQADGMFHDAISPAAAISGPNAGQTSRYSKSLFTNTLRCGGSTKAASASTTMGWDLVSSADAAYVVVPIKPAATFVDRAFAVDAVSSAAVAAAAASYVAAAFTTAAASSVAVAAGAASYVTAALAVAAASSVSVAAGVAAYVNAALATAAASSVAFAVRVTRYFVPRSAVFVVREIRDNFAERTRTFIVRRRV